MNDMRENASASISRQTIAYYDSEAEVYDSKRYRTARGQRAESFHKKVLDLLFNGELSPSSRVLDLGCGTGRLLPHMVSRGCDVCGVDLSEGMLELARKRVLGQQGASNIRLELGAVTEVPFDSNYFDAAYSILVVNLIRDYPLVFAEVARVLRPGGVFVFNVPNLASLWFPVGLYVNVRRKSVTANTAGHRHSHWFLPSEWKASLKCAGFDVEEVKGQPVYMRFFDGCNPLNASGIGLVMSVSVYIKARLRT